MLSCNNKLEPQALADIMPQLIGAFNARANDEGRGTFSKTAGGTKLGEKIADERVTMYSDPSDADLLAQPFDGEGLPLRRVVYIENGVLKNFAYDRFWAAKQSKQPTNSGGGRGGCRLIQPGYDRHRIAPLAFVGERRELVTMADFTGCRWLALAQRQQAQHHQEMSGSRPES